MSEDWTVAQLRDALFDLDVKFTHKDKKADLLALYKKNSKLELGEEPKSPVTNKKSKIIGKGTYGCIFHLPLECEDRSEDIYNSDDEIYECGIS